MHSVVTVRFRNPESASVSIDLGRSEAHAHSPTEKQYAECLLFACFVLRQFRNLGSHPVSSALFEALDGWAPIDNLGSMEKKVLYQHVILHAALDMGMDYQHAEGKYGKPIYLIPENHGGNRRFVGRLEEKSRGPVFFLDVKGFGLGGLLGVGMPQYASDATILFMAELAYQNEQDNTFLPKLQAVASGCGSLWNEGRISMANQEIIAREIVHQQYM